MALIALSSILSIIFGSCIWLAIGDQLPLKEETKWPTTNNIVCYAIILIIPVYLTIFFIF